MLVMILAKDQQCQVPRDKDAQWAMIYDYCGVEYASKRSKRRQPKMTFAFGKNQLAQNKAAGDDNDPRSDAFLQSAAWRRLRYRILKERGARCEACGRGPKDGVVMNCDHIKPRRRYPELALDPNNIQVLCADCNHGKGNWDETDWRQDVEPVASQPVAAPVPVVVIQPRIRSEDEFFAALSESSGHCTRCGFKATHAKWRSYLNGITHLVWWCYRCERQIGASCIAPQWASRLGAGERPRKVRGTQRLVKTGSSGRGDVLKPPSQALPVWTEKDDEKVLEWFARKDPGATGIDRTPRANQARGVGGAHG
jgi:hypothetical protein